MIDFIMAISFIVGIMGAIIFVIHELFQKLDKIDKRLHVLYNVVGIEEDDECNIQTQDNLRIDIDGESVKKQILVDNDKVQIANTKKSGGQIISGNRNIQVGGNMSVRRRQL